MIANKGSGGRGGIRTHEGLAPLAVFKTAALNHSATLPYRSIKYLGAFAAGTSANIATQLPPGKYLSLIFLSCKGRFPPLGIES